MWTFSFKRFSESPLCSFRTVLLLIRIFLEYCQCVNDIPSISTDMLTRLADLLKVRNSTAHKSHDPTLVQPLVVSKQEKTLFPRDNTEVFTFDTAVTCWYASLRLRVVVFTEFSWIVFLQHFNSRSCQLVLGAGALQIVGLKTITTKNLGI